MSPPPEQNQRGAHSRRTLNPKQRNAPSRQQPVHPLPKIVPLAPTNSKARRAALGICLIASARVRIRAPGSRSRGGQTKGGRVGRYLREEGWEGRPRPRRGIAAGEAGWGPGGGRGFGCGRGESARVVETGEELSCRVVRRLSSANGIKVGVRVGLAVSLAVRLWQRTILIHSKSCALQSVCLPDQNLYSNKIRYR